MKNLIYLVLVIAILLFAGACRDKQGKNYNQETAIDQDGLFFLKNGIEGGLTEIKASGLAITKSSNQRVISFAKMMINDHTKAGDQLKKIERDKLVPQDSLINTDHQKALTELSQKSGAAFDKAYLQMMVADHENTLNLFTTGSKNNDVQIKKFASQTLSTIKMHLDSAKAINASLK